MKKTAGWHCLKSLWQLQTRVCNREMEHGKEIKTHAGCYSHQINVTNTMKGTFGWLEKYWKWQTPLTEHNFISMSFKDSMMTSHNIFFSFSSTTNMNHSTCCKCWSHCLLISLSFSVSLRLAFISGKLSFCLTCSSKGEQHHIGPKTSFTKQKWLKR